MTIDTSFEGLRITKARPWGSHVMMSEYSSIERTRMSFKGNEYFFDNPKILSLTDFGVSSAPLPLLAIIFLTRLMLRWTLCALVSLAVSGCFYKNEKFYHALAQ
mmetsp:Transcript_21587/g.31730  ORF Transcript_21587/g.31730 Transcript_21587/m.31730 type:complete len:104 (+) Transcript_21587:1004-1315(+)